MPDCICMLTTIIPYAHRWAWSSSGSVLAPLFMLAIPRVTPHTETKNIQLDVGVLPQRALGLLRRLNGWGGHCQRWRPWSGRRHHRYLYLPHFQGRSYPRAVGLCVHRRPQWAWPDLQVGTTPTTPGLVGINSEQPWSGQAGGSELAIYGKTMPCVEHLPEPRMQVRRAASG